MPLHCRFYLGPYVIHDQGDLTDCQCHALVQPKFNQLAVICPDLVKALSTQAGFKFQVATYGDRYVLLSRLKMLAMREREYFFLILIMFQPPLINYQEPKPWRCGDEFHYRLPGSEGDPWNALLKPLSERDATQCNAWVDEVQNLLIFAGLFSAVVTAFAVETYKGLQEDPVVTLLAQIVVNSAINGTVGTAAPRPFTPTASTIRLNVFLFLSLILSLSTVIVGIVALQWIREHRQHSNTLTPQNMFATLHMRAEALHKWHVPQIFAALPLLLQSALVFFFAGIVQLLVDASTIVLIPVACVMGMTIIFLILTTILPTVQAATLTHPRDSIPAPCPYKSPQSNTFRRLITSSQSIFEVTSLSFAVIYQMGHHLVLLPRKALALVYYAIAPLFCSINRVSGCALQLCHSLTHQVSPLLYALHKLKPERWHGFNYMKPQIVKYWRLHSWLDFDLAWMSVRDNYFQSVCPPRSWLFEHRQARQEYAGLYDATQGLCEELTRNNFNLHVQAEPAIITAYLCALQLCAPAITHFEDVVDSHFVRNQYLTTMLGLGEITPLRPFSDKLGRIELSMFREEASFIFLRFIQEHLQHINEPSALLTNHYAEVYFRLLGELYSKPYEMNNDAHDAQSNNVAFNGVELYRMKIYDTPNQPFTHQWALSITSFFRVLGDRSIPHPIIATSFHAHTFFHGYSANFWRQVKYETHTCTIQEITVNETINTFSVIHDILDDCFTGMNKTEAGHARDKLVFQSVAVHFWNYQTKDITHDLISKATSTTTESLRAAQKRLSGVLSSSPTGEPNPNLDLDGGWLAEGWWVKLFPDAGHEHTIQAITSPTDSGGDLTIQFYAESGGQ